MLPLCEVMKELRVVIERSKNKNARFAWYIFDSCPGGTS
jgi:hypothetical protein